MKNLFRFWFCFLFSFLFLCQTGLTSQDEFKFRVKLPQLCKTQLITQPLQGASTRRAPVLLETNKTLTMGSRIVLILQNDEEIFSEFIKQWQSIHRINVYPFIKGNNKIWVLETRSVKEALQISTLLTPIQNIEYICPEYELNLNMADYASEPNDKYWEYDWHLDRRDKNGIKISWDMNIRSAWPITKGRGSVIAIMDTGIESTHPDLFDRLQNNFHYNAFTHESTPDPISLQSNCRHGTTVAGLAAATAYNGIGTCGIAPESQLASWVMLGNSPELTDLEIAELYIRDNEHIRIQNQSWGYRNKMIPLSPVEEAALNQATRTASNGKGVIMVRAAGNDRHSSSNENFASDYGDSNREPRNTRDTAIVVASVNSDGEYADYSSPGTCILISAPGGVAEDEPSLFSTDLTGTNGYNYINYWEPFEDYNNYANGKMFQGTSFSTPLISGTCALLLSCNTNLTVRDIRHILIQSAQYTDISDPNTQTNSAGFLVSNNTGYGIPDAGHAVELAQNWTGLSPQTSIIKTLNPEHSLSIPSQGYTLQILSQSTNSPVVIPMSIADTPIPNESTPFIETVDLGNITGPITEDLTGKAALIQRGTELSFRDRINYAASAGASFVILYNNVEDDELINMANVDRCPIPAVFISGNSAQKIKNIYSEEGHIYSQLNINSLQCQFEITEDMICEDINLGIKIVGELCNNLYISLISPHKTRSLVYRYNFGSDAEIDWNFLTTQHFYESTYGTWQVEIISMPAPGRILWPQNQLESLSLNIKGIAITDTDHDGLADNWELAHFGTLEYSSTDILSPSGHSNARWQIVGDQIINQSNQLNLDINLLSPGKLRIAWKSAANAKYHLQESTFYNPEWNHVNTVHGKFPITEQIIDISENSESTLYRIIKTN